MTQGWSASRTATASGAVAPIPAAGAVAGAAIGHHAPASVAIRIGQWVASAISVGVGISIVIHIALLLVAAVMSVGIARAGGAGSKHGKDYELSTSEVALTGLSEASLEADAPSAAAVDTELPELPTAGVMEGSGGVDAPASGEGLGQIAEGLGGAGGGDIGDGEGLGAGGAGGGAATFFGVEARGSRFAYVVDVSGSMQGEKLAALKIELNSSVNALLEHMSYFVVAFSNTPQPLGERRKWTAAGEEGKRWAGAQVQELHAEGGTEPWSSIEMVLTMKPAPDAIYFMTDGMFDADVADMIAVRNRGARKVPIHCIAFGDEAAEELLRKIAGQSGGTYAHVKGTR
jgi:hypothetical protein